MCFCWVKRKRQLKPAKFFIAHGELDVFAVDGAIRTKAGTARHAVPAIHFAALLWECVLAPPMAGWHLDCNNIDASIHDARKPSAALIHSHLDPPQRLPVYSMPANG